MFLPLRFHFLLLFFCLIIASDYTTFSCATPSFSSSSSHTCTFASSSPEDHAHNTHNSPLLLNTRYTCPLGHISSSLSS
uniref:Putative secreted protein n=1 Tax=Anopheles triannulatus TaxID=58253 RepID=A0A2M4B5M6_9DIPT